jgi:hypothetical protein
MKKLLMTAALGTLAAGANAQLRFGAEAGVQFANIVSQYPDGSGGTETEDTKPNMGIRGGLVADFGLTDNLSFQPGLLFVMKGGRQEVDETVTEDFFGTTITTKSSYQSKLNLNYIQIPLNFQYHLNDDKTGFFVGAGPYVALGMSGKAAFDGFVEISGTGIPTTRQEFDEDIEVEFGNDETTDMFRRLDFGVGANAGYMLPMGLFFRAFGEYGFSNISNIDVDDYKTKHYGFGLTVGYMIGNGGN